MSEIPERIWLQYHGDASPEELEGDDRTPDLSDVSWCVEQMFDLDIEYVRVEEIQRLRAALKVIANWADPGFECDEHLLYTVLCMMREHAQQVLGEK